MRLESHAGDTVEARWDYRLLDYPNAHWEVRCGARSCRNRLGKVARGGGVVLEVGYYQEQDGVFYRSKKYRHAHPSSVGDGTGRSRSKDHKLLRKQHGDEGPARRFGPRGLRIDTPALVNCHRCGTRNLIARLDRLPPHRLD